MATLAYTPQPARWANSIILLELFHANEPVRTTVVRFVGSRSMLRKGVIGENICVSVQEAIGQAP